MIWTPKGSVGLSTRVAGCVLASVLVACTLQWPTTVPAPLPTARLDASAAERQALAPMGYLRVGLYRGSPSSMVEGLQGDSPRGVGFLLGRAIAQALDVPFQPVIFARNADVLEAAQRGQVDLVFTNATPERARSIAFSSTVLDVEKSVLVPGISSITGLEAFVQRPFRIGVSVGSSTGVELRVIYPSADLVAVPTLQQAAVLLRAGGLDGFATNKAILYELADQVPGARVLDGAWGFEHFAFGVPIEREAGRAFLDRFARQAHQDGRLADAVVQSRLRGTAAPLR